MCFSSLSPSQPFIFFSSSVKVHPNISFLPLPPLTPTLVTQISDLKEPPQPSLHDSAMAKKRKSITTSLDEVDRTLYASFCTAANSLSQLYTHTMNHQKFSFNAGERHALEKVYQWIWRQQEGGSRVGTVDVLNYIQSELDYCEGPSMSPRAPLQHHQSQPTMHVPSSGFPVTSASFGQTIAAQGLRAEPGENQPKNSVFSNALSSPIRQSLQHYQIGEGGCYSNGPSMGGNGNRNTELGFLPQQGRESVVVSSNDSAMDMHAD